MFELVFPKNEVLEQPRFISKYRKIPGEKQEK
jgi:hypothetical protein